MGRGLSITVLMGEYKFNGCDFDSKEILENVVHVILDRLSVGLIMGYLFAASSASNVDVLNF